VSVQVRPARTAAEREAVYVLRHTVWAEQEGKLPPRDDRRVRDGFDEIAATVQLIAVAEVDPIGAVRVTVPSPAGLPTDACFPFDSTLPCAREQVAAWGMMCIDRAHRAASKPFWGLIALAHRWMVASGCTHVIGTFNPDVAPFLERVGARRVGANITHPRLGIEAAPLILDLDLTTMNPTFASLIRRHQQEEQR
jgi:hypothetical protein